MNNTTLAEEFLRLFADIGRSTPFWEMSRLMRGEPLLLGYLFEYGESTPKQLAQVMHVSPARITVILTGLECKHLIKRVLDGSDKRRVHIQLTTDGIQAVHKVRDDALAHVLRWSDCIGEADVQTLIRIVDRLLKNDLAAGSPQLTTKEGDDAES